MVGYTRCHAIHVNGDCVWPPMIIESTILLSHLCQLAPPDIPNNNSRSHFRAPLILTGSCQLALARTLQAGPPLAEMYCEGGEQGQGFPCPHSHPLPPRIVCVGGWVGGRK